MWKQYVTSHPYQMIIMQWSCVYLCDIHQDDGEYCNNEENVNHMMKKQSASQYSVSQPYLSTQLHLYSILQSHKGPFT